LKRILELAGYECVAENTSCWMLVSEMHPAIVPKIGDVVALEIMDSLLNGAKMDNRTYFEYLAQAKIDCGLP
jgi:hypothetical protein